MPPRVMGVVNVTPDSFFDGGRYFDADAAVAHGLQLVSEGADLVDVGGESTRPGASPVGEEEELRRVLPVVEGLASHVRVSIDTTKAAVARAALERGATLLNDESNALARCAAAAGAGLVVMHMRGQPTDMQDDPRYDDVVGEVHSALVEGAERARHRGVEEVYVDPGIGFGKTVAHNLALLRALPELVALGVPVLLGVSRKSFIGRMLVAPGEPPLPPDARLEGSLAVAVWAAAAGVAMLRVHDVRATVQALRLVGDPGAGAGEDGAAGPGAGARARC
ncbi:MAG: dihydropteroate synthase [Acidimicrobiales bacterium]